MLGARTWGDRMESANEPLSYGNAPTTYFLVWSNPVQTTEDLLYSDISPIVRLHLDLPVESTNTQTLLQFQVRKNVLDVSYHVSQYQSIISELKGEIARLISLRYFWFNYQTTSRLVAFEPHTRFLSTDFAEFSCQYYKQFTIVICNSRSGLTVKLPILRS